MIIHVVNPGDTIYSIAESYGISIAKLVQDNDLLNPDSLVPGQTIIIVYPEQTYVVKEGDSLEDIAIAFHIPVMQLLRNNPQLANRDYLEIGEILTISYNTGRKTTTHGFAYPFINKDILLKTLPYLTYLSIFNYTATRDGNIISYYDETDVIKTAQAYDTIPLMMISSLTTLGKPNLETVYELLLNQEVQQLHANKVLNILNEKGYSGINLTFSYLNETNQKLYVDYLTRVSKLLHDKGYLVFVTINSNITTRNNAIQFDRIDYAPFNSLADNFTFLGFVWGTNMAPPTPVSSYSNIKFFLEYVTKLLPPNKINVGTPVVGYNWEMPYSPLGDGASALTLNAAISLAHDLNIPIEFDETSQTPYFYYNQIGFGYPVQHVVWFVDARTINSLMSLIEQYDLSGTGIWNIMIFYTQMWLVINSQFEIIKLVDGNILKHPQDE